MVKIGLDELHRLQNRIKPIKGLPVRNRGIPRTICKGWRTIGGKTKYFRSKWEMNYARYLEFLKVNKQIKEWLYEPDIFVFEGIRSGTVKYKPDFRVTQPDDKQYWIEVKGYMDAKSKTKIKRFAKYYPQNKLLVVDKNWFMHNSKSLKALIPGWE